MKAFGKMQSSIGNCDQHVSSYRNKDLRLDRILVGATKRLYAQALLYPIEKQFDLLALPIRVCNQLGLESVVVGQKSYSIARLILGHHASQRGGIVFGLIKDGQQTWLNAQDVRVGAVHGVAVVTLQLGVRFGEGYKEGFGLMNNKQSLEIQVPAIEQLKRARIDVQQVQGVYPLNPAVADMNEIEDGAAQVQQGVQFDSRFVFLKRCLGVSRKAQVYGRSVEGVDRCPQVNRQRVFAINGPRHSDQVMRKVVVNLPGPFNICIGQGTARNVLVAQTYVLKPSRLVMQIGFDVAQRLAVDQLSKSHFQELIHAGLVLGLASAAASSHASTKSAQWQKRHELRENKLALVHEGPLREDAKDHKSWNRSSNRDQTEMMKNQGKSLTHEALM